MAPGMILMHPFPRAGNGKGISRDSCRCCERSNDVTAGCRVALIAVALALVGCASNATSTITPARSASRARAVSVGVRVVPHLVGVMGARGTAELRVQDPNRPRAPRLFVTLVRGVPREPRDVCFGTYTANESPEDGDVGCQVRGREPLVLTLSYQFIPRSFPVARFTAVYGQAAPGVREVELIGPGDREISLPLSQHRMFLVAFSPTARGTVRLRLLFASGASFTHVFSLPLTNHEEGAWPRVRRRGAVFNYEIGENIVTESYRQIVQRFGPPLRNFTKRNRTLCTYYDIVGYQNGWTFCFKGQAMVGAAGNQPAPPGVH
jgi:hypothetical protein